MTYADASFQQCAPAAAGYDGTCVLKHVGADLYIEHADPRTLISAELLDEIRAGNHHSAVTLDGDLLKIRGVNRTVIYRLSQRIRLIPGSGQIVHLAEWPD